MAMEEYGTLSHHLLASIHPVDRKGVSTGVESLNIPVTEASMEVGLSWMSPFEAMGPEATSPTLLAMVQSGAAADLFSAIGMGQFGSFLQDAWNWLETGTSGAAEQAVGRTGITKMNSTQVFTGMPPIKINMTLLLRAWSNPKQEVENPFDTLMGWALPQCLFKGTVSESILDFMNNNTSGTCPSSGSPSAVTALLPSVSPTMVSLTYKGRTYKPLVIESVGFPMDSPITADGYYTELLVPITLATLTALDAKDWAALRPSLTNIL